MSPKQMNGRIPILPTVHISKPPTIKSLESIRLPGYDEISQVIEMAKDSTQGLDAARRILTQLAHKALKIPAAGEYYKLYQLALEDIGETFDHIHESRELSERV